MHPYLSKPNDTLGVYQDNKSDNEAPHKKKAVEKVSIAPSLAFYQVPKNPGRSGILLPPFSSKDRILFLHFSLL